VRLPSVHAVQTVMLGALLAIAGCLALPAAALAQSGPALTLPSYAVCGTDLTLHGAGFPADARLMIFATRTQPPSDGGLEVARLSSDAAGRMQATLPSHALTSQCREGATFMLAAVRSEGGKPVGEALASTRITFESPTPATSGFGAPGGGESQTNPLLYVLAVIIGVTLLRSRPWTGDTASALVERED